MSQLDKVNVHEALLTQQILKWQLQLLCAWKGFCFWWQELVFILGKVGSYFTKAWCPVAFSKSGLWGRRETSCSLTDSHPGRLLEKITLSCWASPSVMHAVGLQLLPCPITCPRPRTAFSASFLSPPCPAAGQGQPFLLQSVMSSCLDSFSIGCLLSQLHFYFSTASFK